MYPTLLSIAGFHLSSFSIFLILAWCVFSFVFWKAMRDEGVAEERVFDLMFWSTLVTVMAARAGFVAFHWDQFAGRLLAIFAIWVAPGLSVYAGMIGGLVTMIGMARRQKTRIGVVLDAFGLAIPGALIVGSVGSLLDGSDLGKAATLAWAIRYVGFPEPRHPYQLYMVLALAVILLAVGFLSQRARVKKWPLGSVGLAFFLLWAPAVFGLEYFRESGPYWYTISVSGWVTLLLFSAASGAWYVYAGGKFILREIVKQVYAKFPTRRS